MFMQKTPHNSHADSNANVSNSMRLAQAAHQRYLLHLSGEDLTAAINYYIEALKTNPDTPSAYFRLASLLHDNGQIGIESAVEQCRKAVDIDPKNPNAHMYLGYFLSLKGEFEEAKEQFDCIIVDAPPCTVLSDAIILAKKLDSVIMVIRYDYARVNQILRGSESLADTGISMIGYILNAVESGIMGYGYYAYRYGYYHKGYGYYSKNNQNVELHKSSEE